MCLVAGLPEDWDQGAGGATFGKGRFSQGGKFPVVPDNAKCGACLAPFTAVDNDHHVAGKGMCVGLLLLCYIAEKGPNALYTSAISCFDQGGETVAPVYML